VICCTFDFDMYNYFTGSVIDEFALFGTDLINVMKQYKKIPQTWFVRIDDGIKNIFGNRNFVHKTHRDLLVQLMEMGGDIGWHHHPSSMSLSEEVWLSELSLNLDVALSEGHTISRMGYGQMSSRVWELLVNSGIRGDSSCISRPIYPWETVPFRNWVNSPNRPFRPSPMEYSREDTSSAGPIQIPITTVELSFPRDSEAHVRRYINLAYEHDLFSKALKRWKFENKLNESVLVTVTHPYEIFTKSSDSATYPGTISNLRRNLDLLLATDEKFVTIKELAYLQ